MKPDGISSDQILKDLVEILNDVYPNVYLYRKNQKIYLSNNTYMIMIMKTSPNLMITNLVICYLSI